MSWLAEHGFVLLQSAGIIGSLLFTGLQLSRDARARRVENRFTITRNHREIWRGFLADPDLGRVLNEEVDLESAPVTEQERVFVTSIILHLNAAYTAYRENMAPISEGLLDDVLEFFAMPIPASVWKTTKRLRDADFQTFVDTARSRDASR